MSRWATFDCYGTLIDWNGGIRGVLEGLFGADRAPELLARYHRLEPEVQAEAYRSYAEVLSLTLERLATENDLTIPEGESGVLARSLPDWPAFREVPEALAELRRRGWNLAILSNSDRDLIAASQRQLGVAVDIGQEARHVLGEASLVLRAAATFQQVQRVETFVHQVDQALRIVAAGAAIGQQGRRGAPFGVLAHGVTAFS